MRKLTHAQFPVACSLILLTMSSVACDGADEPSSKEATHQAPVVSGTLDTVNQAVVLVYPPGCSGTIIGVDGTNGFVLTAAHCLDADPPQYVIIGNNYMTGDAYPIVDYESHPLYEIGGQAFEDYDFGMVRFTGATPSTPVIEALTPADDTLSLGDTIEHSGFGLYNSLSPCPTQEAYSYQGSDGQFHYMCLSEDRRHGFSTIDALTSHSVGSLQNYSEPGAPIAGGCNGDSGGPQIVQQGGTKRVASVTSNGDQFCTQIGYSGRVSAVYDGFIAPFMDIEPEPGPGGAGGMGQGGGGQGGTGNAAAQGGAGALGGQGGAGALGDQNGGGPSDSSSGSGGDDGDNATPDGNDGESGGCHVAPVSKGGSLWWLLAFAPLALRRRRFTS